MLIISLLVMISVSVTGGFIFLRLQTQFKESQMTSMKELTQITENYIDQYLFTINNLLVVASESGLLTSTNKEALEIFFERQLVLSEDFITSMFFVDQTGELYGYPKLLLNFLPQKQIGKLFPFTNLATFGQTEPFDFPGPGKTLTIYKKVWNPDQSEYIGVLAVNIQPDAILNKITGFDSLHDRSIVIYSHTNKLIGQNLFQTHYTKEEALFLQKLTDRLDEHVQKKVLTYQFQGTPLYSSVSNHNSFGWKVMVLVGQEELYKELRNLKVFFIIFILLAMIVSLIVGYLFSIYLSRPLITVVNQMKHVTLGDLSGRIQIKRKDEIGFLISHFNRMLDRITELIKNLVIMENSKKEAELKMYQAQINPHFLYNTLNSIQWMARMNRLKQVDSAIVQLVPLLQYSLKKEFIVTLKQEMEQIERYGSLQSLRYKGLVKVDLKVDEKIDWNEPCPKMIIQPLVENAIYHGLDPTPVGGKVAVRVDLADNQRRLRIRVIDNGVGMNKEKIEQINRQLQNPELEKRHSGLINVLQRLLFYPNLSGRIHCWSRPDFGTVLEISWERGIKHNERESV